MRQSMKFEIRNSKFILRSAYSAEAAAKAGTTENGFEIPPIGRRLGGFTLIELSVTALISMILVLAVGIVLVSGQRAWQWTYNSANKKIKQDAEAVMITFGNVGRKSNQPKRAFSSGESPLYHVAGSYFTPAYPAGLDPVVFGDAVEFRYWVVGLDKEGSTPHNDQLMKEGNRATAYALFYLEDGKLKVDYDSCTCTNGVCVGAVPLGGGSKNTTPDTRTVVLAENVTTDIKGAFSQTTSGGKGEGSIRINITITDPEDGERIKVMTATLMRTEWPTQK